jgi:diguanylate cyclase (GGDEF)-like protein
VNPLHGRIGAAAYAHLAKGEAVLIVEPGSGGPPRVRLLQLVDANKPANFALLAELNPAPLWGASDGFPFGVNVCVVADTGAMLFCSQPEFQSYLADPSRHPPEAAGAEAMIAGQWQLFLKAKFFAPYWTVIAIEPTSIALAPADKISQILVAVIVLALSMVALLSVSQIRRTMGPLEKLIEGTRLLAAQDFNHKVDVASGDEFGELANSFNDMAARLGRQLGTLKVLSSIDQVILSRMDIDPVFGMALARIRELTPDADAAIIVLEAVATGQARLYRLGSGQQGNLVEMKRAHLDPQELDRLVDRPEGFWLDRAHSLTRSLPQPAGEGRQRLFILPILEGGNLRALTCLAFSQSCSLADDVLIHLRELGDRLGVALSAAARDEQLIYQAHHDDLTGLPNRALFKERLAREIAFALREGRQLALLFIDLDRFKRVNDSLGHSTGDELLEQTAQRISRAMRESDTVARLGGDEFAIILPNIAGTRSVTTVAEQIVRSLSEPFLVGQQESYVSASIGIAICPLDGRDSEELLRKADTAMYRAKDGGRGRFVYFEERMNAEAVERMALERELRQALLRNEFTLHYQPQLDLRTGRVGATEALLRWNHPVRGLIAPSAYISVAEETGLIEEIGRRVIVDACVQHAAWRVAGVRPPRISVNVSVRQFHRGDLVRIVEEALRTTATPANALEIEVTESLFMDESANAVQMIGQLREMGVRVAIDDFGTGYSSLSYLKRLQVDILKIDRTFISDMTDDYEARVVAQAIVSLAHVLGKSVVAEGVETAGQLDLLREWQCDLIQGYYFSRPLTPERLVEFLQQRESAAAQGDECQDASRVAAT